MTTNDDGIWGKWEADSIAPQIWEDAQALLETHILDLDIVYETRIADMPIKLPYDKSIFWNDTILQK